MRRGVAIATLVVAVAATAALVSWSAASEPSAPMPLPVGTLPSSACGESLAEPIDAELRVVVYRGESVRDDEVRRQLEQLATYYQPYRLRFVQLGRTRVLDKDALLSGTPTELDRAFLRADLDPAKPATGTRATRARRLACEVTTAPLRDFMAQHAKEDRRINMVMLRRIATVGSPMAQMLPSLRGLTLSPGGELHSDLRACLDLDGAFSPTILLALDAIEERRPDTLDVTLIHEVGHLLGLEQSSRRNNIMSPEPPKCLPSLTAEQVAAMKRNATGWRHDDH